MKSEEGSRGGGEERRNREKIKMIIPKLRKS